MQDGEHKPEVCHAADLFSVDSCAFEGRGCPRSGIGGTPTGWRLKVSFRDTTPSSTRTSNGGTETSSSATTFAPCSQTSERDEMGLLALSRPILFVDPLTNAFAGRCARVQG